MKLAFTFSADERERVEKVAQLVRTLFRVERVHDPQQKADGFFHLYMNTPKR